MAILEFRYVRAPWSSGGTDLPKVNLQEGLTERPMRRGLILREQRVGKILVSQ